MSYTILTSFGEYSLNQITLDPFTFINEWPEIGIDEVKDELGQSHTLHQFSDGQEWINDAKFPSAVTMTENFLFTTEEVEGTRYIFNMGTW